MKKIPLSALTQFLRQIKNSSIEKINCFLKICSYVPATKLFLASLICLFSIAHVFAQAPPVISSFSPSRGSVGTSVTITGTGFNASASGNIVFFGATMATVTAASSTSLTVTVPVGATYQPISVLNGSTALIGYSDQPFITSFAPNKGAITAGDFMPRVAFNAGNHCGAMVIGDLDGDGKPDLVVLTGANGVADVVSIFRNTSTSGSITAGSFAPKVDFPVNSLAQSLAIGDLDGDGKPDLVVIYNGNSLISVLHNTSTIGTITSSSFAPKFDIAGIHNSFGITISDLDGDGKPDLVVTSQTSGVAASIFRNTSTVGSLTANSFAARVDITGNFNGMLLAVGDLDGDGKPDLVLTDYDTRFISYLRTNKVYVLRNTSTTNNYSFAAPVSFATGSPPSNGPTASFVAIGDLDGDGKPDLVVPNGDASSVSVLRNTSTIGSISVSSFAAHVDFATDYSPTQVTISDLDGDGKPDLAIVGTNALFNNLHSNYNAVSVLRNTAISGSITAESFAPKVDFAIGNVSFGLAICDLDGDGKADIVASNVGFYATGSWVSVLRNNPVFPPDIQATNVSFSGTTTNSATASWTNGNGSSRAVFIAEASTGDALPVNGTAYAANPVFTAGTQIGQSGWYCVYNGTGNTVNITGLSSGATYRIMPVEYYDSAGPQEYLTSTSTGNPANVTTIAGGPITINSINLFTSSPTNAGSVQYNVTFDKAVTGLAVNNFALATTGGISGASISSVSGSGLSYIVTVNTGTGDGTIGLNMTNATSLIPGIITALPFVGSAYAMDRTAPAVIISDPSVSTIPPGMGQVSYSVTYADANFSTSTLSLSDIKLNSTGTANGTISLSGSGTAYTVTVFGITGNGSLGIAIAAGTAVDVLGNITAASNPSVMFSVSPRPIGQAPRIAYGTGKIVATSSIALSVTPKNTGGAIPKTIYGQVSIFAGSPAETGGYTNSIGTAAQFSWPQQMVRDASGNLYVADELNNAIRVISLTGTVNTFAGSTVGYWGSTEGADTSARFHYPDGIVIDGSGNLFVSDYGNNSIRKITPTGLVSTFYTTQAIFGPGGLCFDVWGNLIVSAQDASQIIRITPAGVATTIAGSSAGYANGKGTAAQFDTPTDVRADSAGNIYVVDFNNNAIRKIAPSGAVTTLAGSTVSGNTGGFADGTGTAAVFNNPAGIALAGGGVIYVADMYNNDIRRIMPDGTVTLIAGSAAQVPGDADGVGTASRFNGPDYMYIDNTNGMGYIAEFVGNRIRKIVLTGYTLKGTLPAGLTFDPTTGIISGTATAPFAAQTDTVTAYNAFGYSSAIITLSYQLPVATLSKLKLSSGTLSPAFAGGTTGYTALVGNAVTGITLTPTTTDTTAVVTVNGVTTPSGSASAGMPLSVGVNTITVIVTNGTSSKTYTVAVTRLASDYAYLANLTLSSGTLSPRFTSATLTYTARVSRAISNIAVTPTTVYSFETIKMNGLPIASGTPSSLIPLMDGINNISVVVTAQNGIHTRTYTVIVTKEPGAAKGFYQPANLNSAPVDSLFAVNGIKVHEGVSPNGDGVNDVLVIDGIGAYPENKLLIMDRNGVLVYETEGYNNSSRVFDGHSSRNGAMQAPGTYYYSLEYTDGNEKKYSTGFFIMKY